MDEESLNKWKEEFQNERNEQILKAKKLHHETLKRRKAMELKLKLEAAKEEKRRKEALLERRAQHLEATMRFQKGVKNFKISKEKITLEDALNAINNNTQAHSQKKRKTNEQNSRVVVHNNNIFNYYLKNRHNSAPNSMRKSSSVDNLNLFNNNLSKSSTFQTNFKNRFINSAQITTTQKIETVEEPETKFKAMLHENQKTIADLNKEALKEFQNLVLNEIRSTTSKPSSMTPSSTNIFVNDQDLNKKETSNKLFEPLNFNNQTDIPKDSLIIDDLNSDSLDSLERESLKDEEINEKKQQDLKNNNLNLTELNFDAKLNEIRNHFKQNKDVATEFLANLENRKNYLLQKANEAKNDEQVSKIDFNEIKKPSNDYNHKQPKSILKRSSSDSGVNLLGKINPYVQFGIKVEKIEIKDSIEIAKGNNIKPANEIQLSVKKKSVRFAQNECQSEFIDNIDCNNINDTTMNTVTFYAADESDKRPCVRPRKTLAIKKPDDELENLKLYDDAKPPLPSPFFNNSYYVLNQKRKELNNKFKSRNNQHEFLTSPKAAQNSEDVSSTKFLPKNEKQNEIETTLNTFNSKYGNSNTIESSIPLVNEHKRQITTSILPNQQQFTSNMNDSRTPSYQNTLVRQQQDSLVQTLQINNSNNKIVSRIPPQSPKTYYKSYFNATSVVEIQQIQGINTLRRPSSANTPTTYPYSTNNDNSSIITQQQQQPTELPRQKITSNFINMNQTLPPRILSADHANQKNKKLLNNPVIQLKIHYPNNSKMNEDQNVTLSMAEFLRNEELCRSENGETIQRKQPSMLSIEEQNIRNSIQKLNDRLYALSQKNYTNKRTY